MTDDLDDMLAGMLREVKDAKRQPQRRAADEPQWFLESRVVLVQHQKCRLCDGSVRAVLGEFVRSRNPRLHATQLTRALASHNSLPISGIDTTHMHVEMCADCLDGANRTLSEITTGWVQLTLF